MWCRHCVIREMDSDRAAAYDANAVDVQIIKSEGTGVRRIKLRSTDWVEGLSATAGLSCCAYREIAYCEQGRSDGGYIGIYTPQINPSKLFMG